MLKLCKREATRRALEVAKSSQALAANTPLLEEALALRHQVATLMGYATHADYVLEVRMAKTSAKVLEFEGGLKALLAEPAKKELEKLLELKAAICVEVGDEFDNKVNAWDWLFLDNLLKVGKGSGSGRG